MSQFLLRLLHELVASGLEGVQLWALLFPAEERLVQVVLWVLQGAVLEEDLLQLVQVEYLQTFRTLPSRVHQKSRADQENH